MEEFGFEDISNKSSLTYSQSTLQSDILFRSINIQINNTDIELTQPKRIPFPIKVVTLQIEQQSYLNKPKFTFMRKRSSIKQNCPVQKVRSITLYESNQKKNQSKTLRNNRTAKDSNTDRTMISNKTDRSNTVILNAKSRIFRF